MSWNESGNQQDPWGKPGQKKPEQEQPSGQEKEPNKQSNEPQPPDLEEVFNSLLRKMGGGKGNGSNQNNRPPVSAGKFLPVLLGLGLVVWGASGFYTVQEAERGVVTRFGKLHEIVLPGLNWKPTFIDNVTPVNIERVLELRTNGSMLTQDENMVLVEMTVQYRIEDPAKYLFSVTKPDDSLKQATDSALRYVIGHMTMDDILTTGRAIVREKTWNALRDIIKNYDMGLLITDVNFQYARPPEEVKAAFDDAIKAQEDEQRLIREAEAYARGQEPIARGQAQRILEQANAYKEQVVLNAQGEVQRFTQLLPEYKAAPEVTRDRLYIQTMEKVMKNTPKLMVDSSNGNNLTVLPIDKLMAKPTVNEAVKTPSSQPVIQQQPQLAQPVSPAQLPAVEQSEPVRKGRF
ncbi:FtsH protease activity modulator HflK [Glaesserella parasuis]|uniref:Protein HflK n=1 Tax=Glaesserella parasuis serovar 5 (strain SH0165) TaxID=557723 RepID=B8F8E8_GLAP5|nr:FtsH protease activity modulator HflK [Glaesserella parasuis]ACL33600.1 protein HflK/membrane protease subunit, stomatin/prohibitin-like protein [Glaesserella parasuis SH0165]MDG6238615.1 FtsH protease activity modulator HflK [Glaesserella parasuis]MDG6247185.1 FtsH protease activity modulator HflK [Glaesserella parasuis]MDG6262395.1 FtsH protease activity modulator HflK [Glaesserella parasuis]MDG6279363.1 FtsH protease activity modulator HflK [Glaesserella parasuis]